jgi:carbon starvation protein CstA
MSKFLDISDKSAIVLSLLCTVHCIATPLLLIMLPSISGLMAFDPEALHLWLLFAVIPISLFAVIMGYFHHRRAAISGISLVGILLLICAVVFGHDIWSGKGEVVLTVLGSFVVAYGHLKNLRIRQNESLSMPIVV